MPRLLQSLILAAVFATGAASAADNPAFVGKHVSTPADIAAINTVITSFQTAIKTKDSLLLSSLLLNNRILFSSPARPEGVKMVNEKFDANADGIEVGGAESFLKFIRTEKAAVEERFYDIKITQDDNIAFVIFDFDFLINDKVVNHGVEAWQMMKAKDGKWKIVSVYWSSKGTPK